jgi:VCBS repeat-containing protein
MCHKIVGRVQSAIALAISIGVAACGGGSKPNRPPQLTTPSVAVDEDVVLSTQLSASDPDGQTLTFSKTGDPQHGSLTVAASGAITYTPALNYNGADQFTVQVSDTRGGTASGTVAITVRAVNDAPALTAASFSGDEETTISGQVTASDVEGDSFTMALAGQPNHGNVTLTPDGAFAFQPDADFFGVATFEVAATDVRGATQTQPVSIDVRNVNDAPIAHDDELRVGTGTVTLSLLANDVDGDGDNLSVAPLSQPRGGTVSVTGGNIVTFQPENAFVGPTTFDYRITDASGITSDATAKLVVGNFPGVVFVADETTPGTRELHFYDGFRTVRVSTALQAGARVDGFTLASDRRHVAYVVHTANFEQVFLSDLEQPGSAQHLYTTSGISQFSVATTVTLNRDASYALINDSTHPSPLQMVLVRTVDASLSVVGASNPELIRPGLYAAFNPVTDEFYVQAQVGGLPPPMSGTGYLGLFGASTSAPAPLLQLGASYVPDQGNGSGHLLAVTPNGERVVHVGYTSVFPATGYLTDLLVNYRPGNSESYAFRPFALFEYQTPVGFRLSNDGARVCYILALPPSNQMSGPTRVWFSDLAAPANGTAASPLATSTFGCLWAADNHSIVYISAPVTGQFEIWVADALQPGTVQRLREPLAAGEEVDYYDVARRSMTAVFGIRPSGSVIPDLYRASIDAPGSSVKFATGSFLTSGTAHLTLNPHGTLLAYAKSEPIGGGPQTMTRLHLMSTQTAEYDWTLSRPDASAGVLQFEFVSSP